jgi:hypothetical protein
MSARSGDGRALIRNYLRVNDANSQSRKNRITPTMADQYHVEGGAGYWQTKAGTVVLSAKGHGRTSTSQKLSMGGSATTHFLSLSFAGHNTPHL